VARFHPQRQVDEGCHKVLRGNEKKKSYSCGRLKKNKQRNFFFLGKTLPNDEPSHYQMHLVNRKNTRGGRGKQNF
jgi:hypothetical protein